MVGPYGPHTHTHTWVVAVLGRRTDGRIPTPRRNYSKQAKQQKVRHSTHVNIHTHIYIYIAVVSFDIGRLSMFVLVDDHAY